MKKAILLFSFIFLMFSVATFAQKNGEEEQPISIDTLLDRDAQGNLNKAWHYFKLRKAYKAVLARMEETVAAHPTFSKMDEVLYLSGMSSYYLANNKGKQKVNFEKMTDIEKEKYDPKKLREDAEAYLSELIENHPDSKYAKKAKKTLKKLENVK